MYLLDHQEKKKKIIKMLSFSSLYNGPVLLCMYVSKPENDSATD